MTFHCACSLPQQDCDFPFCKSGTEEEQKRARAFQAGAASRDDEVAELIAEIDRKMSAGAFVLKEVDQLREQVRMLREALKEAVEDYSDRFDMSSQNTNPGIKVVVKRGKEALAATEEK